MSDTVTGKIEELYQAYIEASDVAVIEDEAIFGDDRDEFTELLESGYWEDLDAMQRKFEDDGRSEAATTMAGDMQLAAGWLERNNGLRSGPYVRTPYSRAQTVATDSWQGDSRNAFLTHWDQVGLSLAYQMEFAIVLDSLVTLQGAYVAAAEEEALLRADDAIAVMREIAADRRAQESQKKTGLAGALDAVRTIATGVSTGMALGGPWGAVVGGVVGAGQVVLENNQSIETGLEPRDTLYALTSSLESLMDSIETDQVTIRESLNNLNDIVLSDPRYPDDILPAALDFDDGVDQPSISVDHTETSVRTIEVGGNIFTGPNESDIPSGWEVIEWNPFTGEATIENTVTVGETISAEESDDRIPYPADR